MVINLISICPFLVGDYFATAPFYALRAKKGRAHAFLPSISQVLQSLGYRTLTPLFSDNYYESLSLIHCNLADDAHAILRE